MLYSFTGGNDGQGPSAGPISDATGALYGTTYGGGGFSGCTFGQLGCGTVFKLTPPAVTGSAWTETVLHSFAGSDGAHPSAGSLIFDLSGVLYGLTQNGGANNSGTAFKLTQSLNTCQATYNAYLPQCNSTYNVATSVRVTLPAYHL